MATSSMIQVLHDLRAAVMTRGGDLSDAELLGCFIATHDESAFEAIVRRHGPMVMGVCRRALRNPHDVDDAFQATFLVLVRKAASIQAREQLANWLYGVAYNTALKAKAMSARHGEREKQVTEMPEPRVPHDDRPGRWDDFQPLLDQEMSRLPDKYRIPIVLCDLEGYTGKQAAEQLGWPEGTVSGRLSRGRALLAKRLARNGMKLSAAALVLMLTQKAAASVPAALMNTTIQSACLFAAGQAASTGVISAQVAALTEGVLKAMLLTKLKMAATGLLVVLCAGLGIGIVVHQVLADRPGYSPVVANAEEQERRPGGDANVVTGKVVAVTNKGKTVTLELPPLNRGDDARRQDLVIGEKTEVTFDGVGPNGAAPSDGLVARVTLKEGTTDVPIKIHFSTPDRTAGARLRGIVSAISADGTTITVESPAGRDPNAEKVKTEFKVNKETKFIYDNIAKSAAKPMIGFMAIVWHVAERGQPEGAASKVMFMDVTRRGALAPMNGKIVSFTKGGDSITIEAASKVRGEGPTKTVIKLTVATEITYHGVSPDGAKLTEGYHVGVWLEEGSTDTAARLMVIKDTGVRRER